MMPYSPISGTDTTVQGQYVIRPVRQPILSWIESATCVSATQARFFRILSSPKWSQMRKWLLSSELRSLVRGTKAFSLTQWATWESSKSLTFTGLILGFNKTPCMMGFGNWPHDSSPDVEERKHRFQSHGPGLGPSSLPSLFGNLSLSCFRWH